MLPLKCSVKIRLMPFEERYDKAVLTLAKQSQNILVDYIKREYELRNVRASEDLINSVEAKDFELTSEGVFFRAGTDDIAGAVAEYGSKPSQYTDKRGNPIVNIYEIEKWLEIKDSSVAFGTLHQKAYAIARKIGEHGLPLRGIPKRIVVQAKRKALREINRLWESQLPELLFNV